MNRLLILMISTALVVAMASCAHADTSLFVATDRHA